MKTGDKIKYSFPDPSVSTKEFITGQILKVLSDKITVRCDDNSIMIISFKNYVNIQLMETEELLKQ